MKIYLDDEHELPADYDLLVRTVEQAQELILSGRVTKVSIDYDLGIGYTQGTELTKWIVNEARLGHIKRLEWDVHTGNIYVAKQMYRDLMEADKYWSMQECKTTMK